MNLSMIKGINFGILSPEFIKNMATVRVVSSDLYDADGYPIEGGVMDPRMGVVDPGLTCRTCNSGLDDCMGHFGYLELAKPIVHVLYTKIIATLLKTTCRSCSRLLVKDKDIEKKTKIDVKGLAKAPPKTCPHCKKAQKKIIFEKTYTFYEEKTELTSKDIRERLEKIIDEDLKKTGFRGGRPEWLVLTLFPVPPVTMRPSITLETGERSEDDLTHKLADIVRINQSLKENIDIGAPEFILNDLWELVQYHVSTYFDNELPGVPHARHRSGRPLKGLVQRLKAKEGRIRGNLLGKRVNFSARTVISPDPRISINEVGVPEIIAKELTVPEFITESSMKYCKDLIKSGKVNYLNRPDGRKVKITEDNKKDILENIKPGWTIDRQIENGDIVLFNRQPSLHKVSIMAHRVKIMPYRTFRISPQVCPPYNADFDGDEMNLHVPQTEEAKLEASMLMEVHRNIISPRSGGPVIGLDLDQVTGVYLLTRDEVKMNKEEASQLLANAGIDIDLPDKKEFTGKEIFSFIIPKEVTMHYPSISGKNVRIEKGEIKEGIIDSKSVGAFKGRLLIEVKEVKGDEGVKDFIDQSGRLGVAYLMKRGITIGISDIDLPSTVRKRISEEIESAIRSSDKLVDNYNKGNIKILPGLTQHASLEAQVMNSLAQGLSNVSDIVSEKIEKSDIINMVNAGSKGSLINTTQMAACVGQETILGQRMKRGYLDRTLAHFKKGDLSPQSRGFVSRGFKQGLTPFEVFWNIMNGREGLMDKSLRTRKSGYMQRRLVNALQDLKVEEDGSVRSSRGVIVQFLAGEDGISPLKSSWGKIEIGE